MFKCKEGILCMLVVLAVILLCCILLRNNVVVEAVTHSNAYSNIVSILNDGEKKAWEDNKFVSDAKIMSLIHYDFENCEWAAGPSQTGGILRVHHNKIEYTLYLKREVGTRDKPAIWSKL